MDETRRLALIGPVTPFRGGIAHYTTELHRALSPRCTLHTISFRRQYPTWLYPGKNDREPGNECRREPHVAYQLDAFEPWTWFATSRRILERGCELAIIDWWTMFWAPALALIAQRLRASGVPVAFVCHNLSDHDGGLLARVLGNGLLGCADAYVVHAKTAAEELRARFPHKPVLACPHPTYDRFPPADDTLPRRGRLELLFFGFIRPYKGLETLVQALAMLDDHEVYLTVAGEPWCAPAELRERIGSRGVPNVELHLDYVDAAAVASFFSRADLVVLPYHSATGSGVAAIAQHYDRPVLATCVGGLPDVVEEGRTGYLVEPDSATQLADRLATITRADLELMHPRIHSRKGLHTFASLADALLVLALELRGTSGS